MAGGDVSGCLEVSSGYGNMIRFDSGKFGVSFDCTGGVDERIWGKDPTVDVTAQGLYIEYIQLTGCATGGPTALIDGSDAGQAIVSLANSDASYGGGGLSGVWDFHNDPIICLTAENTESICISSTVNGHVAGFMKCYWGPISS